MWSKDRILNKNVLNGFKTLGYKIKVIQSTLFHNDYLKSNFYFMFIVHYTLAVFGV